ncbi:uncharacterized protein TrAFT101_006384 [Trichoderma asperellum]|uniref:uncharacterized protein n=1 Tax=Trichoderma asperellum TaxID=101201 RepID=UPI00331AB139|nr:hypothetical protein TrAFT101_006384 [Trichoderma asperellum]
MIIKWARFGPDMPSDVQDDFMRLTLNSIPLCAMGTRFHSFYHESQHPFVRAMVGVLTESFTRSRRPPLSKILFQTQEKKYREDIEELEAVAKELLNDRRANPRSKKDLLNAMILNKDPKTGESLDNDTIIRNMIIFLIAEVYRKTQEEIDTVGSGNITLSHTSMLPYIKAYLRETLRLHPTEPAFTLQAKGDQILDDRFLIKDGEYVQVLLAQFHRDPELWSPNAEEFKPSRMMDKAFGKPPPNAWKKPFGKGIRACIGRTFAWQESPLVVASLLQAFHFTNNNPSYQLRIQTTPTIKPQDFFIRARLRDPSFLDRIAVGPTSQLAKASATSSKPNQTHSQSDLPPLLVLFGSNT